MNLEFWYTNSRWTQHISFWKHHIDWLLNWPVITINCIYLFDWSINAYTLLCFSFMLFSYVRVFYTRICNHNTSKLVVAIVYFRMNTALESDCALCMRLSVLRKFNDTIFPVLKIILNVKNCDWLNELTCTYCIRLEDFQSICRSLKMRKCVQKNKYARSIARSHSHVRSFVAGELLLFLTHSEKNVWNFSSKFTTS